MKQLTCEMCGSTDLIKQDGIFVCQSCGTKYSVEEAKRMMVEGTVEVAGTVKLDNSDQISSFLLMANSAYNAGNHKEAEQYCNKIIEIAPNNYQAWLLKGKAAGWQTTLANIRIEESVSCFTKAIENAPENAVEDMKKAAAKEISDLSVALVTLCCNNYSKNGSVANATSIINNANRVQLYALMLLAKCGVAPKSFKRNLAIKINSAAVAAYVAILKDYGSTYHPSQVACVDYTKKVYKVIEVIQYAIGLSEDDNEQNKIRYGNIIVALKALEKASFYHYHDGWTEFDIFSQEQKKEIINLMMDYHKKIKEIDPSYVIPMPPEPTKTSGCYVATAVYGSYDCPQVWTLRRYRDNTLAKTWYGRAFIHTYYAISPTLVRWFGNCGWFKNMWKPRLDKMVEKLQQEGVADTPYNDRVW